MFKIYEFFSSELRDIVNLYSLNKLSVEDVRQSFSQAESSKILSSLEELDNSVQKILVEPFIREATRLIINHVELYTSTMSTVSEFLENLGLEFSSPDKTKVRNDIRNFLIWRKPILETRIFIKIVWEDDYSDIISIWPLEQSLKLFLSNKGTSTIALKTLITKCLSDPMTKVCING